MRPRADAAATLVGFDGNGGNPRAVAFELHDHETEPFGAAHGEPRRAVRPSCETQRGGPGAVLKVAERPHRQLFDERIIGVRLRPHADGSFENGAHAGKHWSVAAGRQGSRARGDFFRSCATPRRDEVRLGRQGRRALERDFDVTLRRACTENARSGFANARVERYALCLMLGLHVSVSHSFARIFGIGALVSLALAACADHRPLGPLRDGDAACQDLVAQCQEPSALGEPYRSCYATGMRGDGDACLSAHDDCIKSCANAPASAGAGGEGGHGEAGSSNAAGGPGVNAGGGGVSGTDGTAETGGVAETAGTGAVTAAGGAAEAGHAAN